MRNKWVRLLAFGMTACILAGCSALEGKSDMAASSQDSGGTEVTGSRAGSSEALPGRQKPAGVMKCRTPEPEKIPLKAPGTLMVGPHCDLEAFSGGNVYTINKDDAGATMLYQNDEAVGEYDWDLGFASDLVIGDLYFSLVGIGQEDGTMNMNLTVYNLQEKTKKTVYSAPLTNYRSYLYPLGDSEVMFSYNGIEDGEKYEFTGVYNFREDSCRIISKHPEGVWDDSQETTGQEITAVCADGELIYFAKEQRIDGEVAVFLTCLDREGNVLYEDEVEPLSRRWRPDTNIQWIDVSEDSLFISYYTAGIADPRSECKPVVLTKTADGYAEWTLEGGVNFSRRIGSGLVDGRYLLFSSTMDDDGGYPADFIAFDLLEGDYRLIQFDLEGIESFRTFVDEQGNLLAVGIDDQRKRYYFRVDADEWL